jgi:tol-pal system protein YbgF
MKMYQRAFGLFQKKEWGDAMLAFETFVRAHPSHEYADNAYYWMGECFYAQAEYALAIEEFQKIPELYPGGNKVPDALLKIGLAYHSLNNMKSAAKTFRQLVDAYPQSEAAELGRKRLAQLPQ